METNHINTESVSRSFKKFSSLTKPFVGERWFRLQEWEEPSFCQEYLDYAPSILAPFTDTAKTSALLVRAAQGQAISLNGLMELNLLATETVDMIDHRMNGYHRETLLPALEKDIRELDEHDARELSSHFDESTSFVLLAASIIHDKLTELGIPRPSTASALTTTPSTPTRYAARRLTMEEYEPA